MPSAGMRSVQSLLFRAGHQRARALAAPLVARSRKPKESFMDRRHSFLPAFLALLLVASPAGAAEGKLLGPVSLRALLPELLPQFEKSSGHKVTVGYATLGAITERLVKGEPVDVAIVSPVQNEDLQKQGKL